MAAPRQVDPPWDIRVEGRAWASWEETLARLDAIPEKFEVVKGRLFDTEKERLTLLAALLENVGLAAAVRLSPIEKDRRRGNVHRHRAH